MNKNRLSYILIISLLLISPVLSQNQDQRLRKFNFVPDSLENSRGQTDKMPLIHQFLARGAYISAADLLEGMYEQRPNDRNIINLLLLCYSELKAFEKAEMLLQRQLEKNPNDYQYQFQLLELHLKSGNDSLITTQISNILDRFPGDSDVYSTIIQLLIRDGYPDRGLDLIKRARAEFGDDNLFILESASLYEIRQRYYDAIMEYFKAVSGDSSLAIEADRRTAALIRYPLAPPDAVRAFEHILDSLPDNLYALNFLSETYIMQGRYSEAFEAVIRIDSIGARDGKELLGYLRRCRERKLYEQVIQVADYVERRYPESNILMSYRLYRAEALRGIDRPYDAMAVYKLVGDGSLNKRDRYEALLQIGNIYRYDMIKYDSARIFYDSVMYRCPYTRVVYQADLEKAQILLVEGRLDDARTAFGNINRDRLTDDLTEFLDFNQAMIDFLAGDFETAELEFRKLMQLYPRGFYLNDALMNSLIISESMAAAPDVLSEYAAALLFKYRLMPDSMEASLRSIIDRDWSPLAGIAHYQLARDYFIDNSDSLALDLIDNMEKDYQDDYFYPYCLMIKGDILSRRDDKRDEAIEVYRMILADYGNYPFIGEIRKKLQELEGYRPAG